MVKRPAPGHETFFPWPVSEMLLFSISCFVLSLLPLNQLVKAAENDRYVAPLALGRVSISYHSPLELSLFSAAKDGNLAKVDEILTSNRPLDTGLLEKVLFIASDMNRNEVVRAILAEQVLGVHVIQKVLLDAAQNDSGETVAEILKSGTYDSADLGPTFRAALTLNSVSVVKVFLQFPKFSYPDANRARALELCRTQKFTEMEKLLMIPREQLLTSATDGYCTIF